MTAPRTACSTPRPTASPPTSASSSPPAPSPPGRRRRGVSEYRVAKSRRVRIFKNKFEHQSRRAGRIQTSSQGVFFPLSPRSGGEGRGGGRPTVGPPIGALPDRSPNSGQPDLTPDSPDPVYPSPLA